jgi:hypothetical protein
MTMLDEKTLRTVLRTRLHTVSGLPSAIAFEGRVFQPPTLTTTSSSLPLWVEEQVRILSETKSATGQIEALGEALYSVYTPSGRGTEQADALAKLIAEAFQSGQGLSGSGLELALEHTERRPMRQDVSPYGQSWMFKTVAIRWRAFTAA